MFPHKYELAENLAENFFLKKINPTERKVISICENNAVHNLVSIIIIIIITDLYRFTVQNCQIITRFKYRSIFVVGT